MSTTVIGHRGSAGQYPENTLVSIQSALEQGCQWVEIDVQPTRDDYLVVCHDHTIDRCSNGQGRIDEFTLEELKGFDFGSWHAITPSPQTILTLEELLTFAHQQGLKVNIEVKIDRHNAKHVAQEVHRVLEAHDIPLHDIVLSSFNQEVLRHLAQLNADYPIGVLEEALSDQGKHLIQELNAFSCHLNYRHVKEEDIQWLKQHKVKAWCYTVNLAKDFSLLAQVDGIFTDWPARFIEID
ncbi:MULTISPECIES: glycerophosphodiester phosphodiesterase family protein [unclassified Vibrio]|uniref:Glycerophosphodiester phosphodiesterase n=1 Tax=Vibrio sp. HB236076 TaxID=3232307 RepID=A0AB39HHX4_9VIBR|nr:glycerophosphodiester phosphodiesterase family protein [Vibrio sp. HB161653]MDP5253283.1 glycerophosphodiester phosphodiesterase family protein [Vibrio sp. HB161653]